MTKGKDKRQTEDRQEARKEKEREEQQHPRPRPADGKEQRVEVSVPPSAPSGVPGPRDSGTLHSPSACALSSLCV